MKGIDLIRLSIIGGIVLLSLSFLLRVLPPTLRIALLLVLLGLSLVLGFLSLRSNLLYRKKQRAYAKTTAGQMEARQQECGEQIERHESEKTKIEASIKQLKEQLRKAVQHSPIMVEETKALMRGFEQELKLRTTKITFFRDCAEKLQTLLQQHHLLQDLEAKKQELENLREKHFEDIADMENLRWNVERESVYLDTLEELSLRMQRSDDLDDVIHLQNELEQMTQELGNNPT